MIALLMILLVQAARPPASISGTVIDADSVYRLPLNDARIEMNLPDRAPLVTRTGVDGQFSVSDLAPGSYRLTVTANGFIRESLPVNVAAGQQRKGVVLALKVAPAITGRIKDEYNVPAAHLIVEAMKVIYGPRGDRSVAAFASTLTDDRGEFNLAFLDPGDYTLFAWQNVEPNAYLDPSFLQRYESTGTRMTIAVGSEGTVSLPLIPLD
jgi:uncharacterized surface anchored protein